jgi:hypothetical protein
LLVLVLPLTVITEEKIILKTKKKVYLFSDIQEINVKKMNIKDEVNGMYLSESSAGSENVFAFIFYIIFVAGFLGLYFLILYITSFSRFFAQYKVTIHYQKLVKSKNTGETGKTDTAEKTVKTKRMTFIANKTAVDYIKRIAEAKGIAFSLPTDETKRKKKNK